MTRKSTQRLADAAKHIFDRAASAGSNGWAKVLVEADKRGPSNPPPTWLITALAEAASSHSRQAIQEVLAAYDRALSLRQSSKAALQSEVRKAIDFHVYVLGNAGWSVVGLPPRGERPSDELERLLSEYRDIQIDKLSMDLHREADHHFGELASDQPPSWWDKHGWSTLVGLGGAVIGAVIGALLQSRLG